MSDSKEQALESKLSNIFGLICVVLFFIGPLKPEVEEKVSEHHLFSVLCIYHPPCFPPKSPTQSAGPLQKCNPTPLEIDQNFDYFLTSFLDRFWVVLGCHLGVIFGTFGGQDAPSSVKSASWKPIHIKNVIVHQTHARVYRSANLGAKMASKMPQDRPKTAPRGS